MNLDWHSIVGEVILPGDYERIVLLEKQHQTLLLSKRTFWVVDLKTFEVLHMENLDTVKVQTALLDNQQHRLYIGTEYGKKLLVFDLHTYQQTTISLKAESRGLALVRKHQQLYSIGFDTVTVIALKGKKPSITRVAKLKGDAMGLRLALSPDEQTLVAGRHGQGELYRADSFSFKGGMNLPKGVEQLAYSPSGEFLASAGGQIHVPRLPDGSADLDRIDEATYSDTQILIWDPESGQRLYQSEAQGSIVKSLVWHPKLPLLASATGLGSIRLWELPPSGDRLLDAGELDLPPHQYGIRDLVFTADGRHLLVLCQGGLVEYRLEGSASLKHLPTPTYVPEATLSTPIFHPEYATWHEGQLWISNQRQWAAVDPATMSVTRASEVDEHAHLLRIEPQQGVYLRLRSNNSLADRIELRTLEGTLLRSFREVPRQRGEHEPTYVSTMRLDEGGNTLTFSRYGRLFHVPWNTPEAVRSAAFEDEEHFSRFSFEAPPGLALSTASSTSPTVRLWNTTTLASMLLLEEQHLWSFSGWTTSLHLSAGGRLALGTSKGEVGLFHLSTGQLHMRGTRHGDGQVHDLAFSADETLLASAAADQTVRLWDTGTGEEVAVFQHEAAVHVVRFSPHSNSLLSIDQQGTLSLWNLDGIKAWRDLSTSTPLPVPGDEGGSAPAEPPEALLSPNPSNAGPETEMTPKQRYAERAAQAGLREFADRSWDLYSRTPFEQAPRQQAGNLVTAYQEARGHAEMFRTSLEDFGARHGAQVRIRPSAVKDANRSIEKMLSQPTVIPADLLAGTLIAASVREMYHLAEHLHEAFTVVSFRDRMIARVRSGYGDLQFLVSLGGHLAEVKVVHRLFQAIDRYEHRLYEIQRTLDAEHPKGLPLAERIVGEALERASQQMYTEAWTWIVRHEGGSGD